jgi:hypothetical protein
MVHGSSARASPNLSARHPTTCARRSSTRTPICTRPHAAAATADTTLSSLDAGCPGLSGAVDLRCFATGPWPSRRSSRIRQDRARRAGHSPAVRRQPLRPAVSSATQPEEGTAARLWHTQRGHQLTVDLRQEFPACTASAGESRTPAAMASSRLKSRPSLT